MNSDFKSVMDFSLSIFSNVINLFKDYFILKCALAVMLIGRFVNIIKRSFPNG